MKQSVKLILLVVLYGAQWAKAQTVTDVTNIADCPYAAFIEFVGGSGDGAIVSDTQVLTSASTLNVRSGGNIFVFVGNATLRRGKRFTTQTYQVHPSYNPSTLENNVAIVTIGGAFSAVPNVKPIAIRSSPVSNSANCFSIGWGIRIGDSSSDFPRRVNYTLVTDQECATKLGLQQPTIQCASSLKGSGWYETNAFLLICENRLYGVLSAANLYTFSDAQPIELFTKLTATSIQQYLSGLIPRKNYVSCD
uniref:Putative trypsin-like serine protease n=1 Tax=Anopheles marajoara TaxID=58244 RepID=A0A2M4BY58_9DIPT